MTGEALALLITAALIAAVTCSLVATIVELIGSRRGWW